MVIIKFYFNYIFPYKKYDIFLYKYPYIKITTDCGFFSGGIESHQKRMREQEEFFPGGIESHQERIVVFKLISFSLTGNSTRNVVN